MYIYFVTRRDQEPFVRIASLPVNLLNHYFNPAVPLSREYVIGGVESVRAG